MIEFIRLILHIMVSFFKPRTKLVAEILILRQQLNVLLVVVFVVALAATVLKALG